MIYHSNKKGFTLLELLIVIAIIAILSVILIIVLDPAETLKKARDSQRMSDLGTLKTALGIYLTSTSTPYLSSATSSVACKGTSWASPQKIFYSLDNSAQITDTTLDGGSGAPSAGQSSSASSSLTNGTGWVPVNLDVLTGGSPISNLPTDPVNTVSNSASVASTDLVYRYACNSSNKFEINAQLESNAFTVDDNKKSKDGGNNNNLYEVGTAMNILGSGTDF